MSYSYTLNVDNKNIYRNTSENSVTALKNIIEYFMQHYPNSYIRKDHPFNDVDDVLECMIGDSRGIKFMAPVYAQDGRRLHVRVMKA